MTFPEGDLSAPENAWLKTFDLEKFTKEIADLGKVRKQISKYPYNHFIIIVDLLCAIFIHHYTLILTLTRRFAP